MYIMSMVMIGLAYGTSLSSPGPFPAFQCCLLAFQRATLKKAGRSLGMRLLSRGAGPFAKGAGGASVDLRRIIHYSQLELMHHACVLGSGLSKRNKLNELPFLL